MGMFSQILGESEAPNDGRPIDQVYEDETACRASLSQELETYVADMRASWPQSMIPRSKRSGAADGILAKETVAA